MTKFFKLIATCFAFASLVFATSLQISMAATSDVVDVSTFDDYTKVKAVAWQKYEQQKAEAWEVYEKAMADSWSAYDVFDQAELRKLRAGNREAYLQWLDAEKIRDDSARWKLENDVPELAAYISLMSEKLKAHQAEVAAAYQQYTVKNSAAYKAYQADDATAYAAYQTAPKK